MKIVLFNEKLIHLHQLFDQILKEKALLKKIPNNDFLKSIILFDTQKRGFIQKQKLLMLMLLKDNHCQNQTIIKKYLNEVFPFEKISYTVLIGHLLRGGSEQQEWEKQTEISYFKNSQQISSLDSGKIISNILWNQCLISSIKDQILPQIQKCIPFCAQNLTCEQLSEYLHSQSINLNPEKILKCLNGLTCEGSSKYLQYKFFKQNQEQPQTQLFSNELQMQLSQIKQITERLSNRVQNFGSSWLK